ncbi:hypothetical protein [Jannaschia sp. 2305UL9-9]|uniref:hypothetical protein n=1 Tax=Jannaschia sp. 2305UL9-9 TaxID=3121638 RepID=UPI0035298F49
MLSFSWLGLIGWFFLTLDPVQARLSARDPLGFMMTILGVFLPVALVWVAASAARTARTMREESERLQAAIDAMRLSYVEQQQMAGVSLKRDMEERIDTVARAQAVLGAEVAGLHAATPTEKVLEAPRRPQAPQQPTLALEARSEGDPLPPEDFIRAMNFPENERDTEGFRVLRRALEHHQTAQLITAAQDVLTLLSQESIYMDDLSPHRANASIWRGFAEGLRGEDIRDLAGVRDRSSLALTSARMKRDPVFRDAVHHFLRMFDRVFSAFCEDATDSEITRMTDTRTARAFMLCGAVAGIFE